MAEVSPKEKKTLWEKEKLLVTSNFSFSHSVLEKLVLQTREKPGLFGKDLTLFQTSPGFYLSRRSSLFPQRFRPVSNIFCHIRQT